jgi:hypothetical protein
MDALQYEITLPADYDMGIIRKRVADFGHLADAARLLNAASTGALPGGSGVV